MNRSPLPPCILTHTINLHRVHFSTFFQFTKNPRDANCPFLQRRTQNLGGKIFREVKLVSLSSPHLPRRVSYIHLRYIYISMYFTLMIYFERLEISAFSFSALHAHIALQSKFNFLFRHTQ